MHTRRTAGIALKYPSTFWPDSFPPDAPRDTTCKHAHNMSGRVFGAKAWQIRHVGLPASTKISRCWPEMAQVPPQSARTRSTAMRVEPGSTLDSGQRLFDPPTTSFTCMQTWPSRGRPGQSAQNNCTGDRNPDTYVCRGPVTHV